MNSSAVSVTSAAGVVPRVIPLFLREIATSPQQLKLRQLLTFATAIDDVFAAKVDDEDVVELLWVLIMCLQHSESEFDKDMVNVSMRILARMFAPTSICTPQCYRGLRKLVKTARKDDAELVERTSVNASDAATTGGIAALSPVRADATPSGTNVGVATPAPAAVAAEPASVLRAAPSTASSLSLDVALNLDSTRAAAMELLRRWDESGIEVSIFTATPATLHVFLPLRQTQPTRVYRDFLCCTARPKLTKTWGSVSCVHIKTNVRAKSEIMYRFLVEGYNYGVNAVLFNDVVGYTNRHWEEVGQMTKYGWPEGWDGQMCNDYAHGATVSQYYSTDKFLVLKLQAKSMFNVGFSVSAWLVFHGMGNGFPVSAEVFHQDEDL